LEEGDGDEQNGGGITKAVAACQSDVLKSDLAAFVYGIAYPENLQIGNYKIKGLCPEVRAGK
jgi:hypothetical protein